MDLKHTLGADTLNTFQTFVDVSYATHDDMRSHTGGVITFGRGSVYAKLSKKQINVKSSTEGEIVGASEFLPYHIWYKNFMEAQGYEIQETTFHQDNKSSIQIENNGLISCGQKSHYINVRYCFLKDRLTGNNIKVIYCPTERMVADFMSKPVQ